MSENGEIYTAGKNFTLPPALTGWTNSTSDWSDNHHQQCHGVTNSRDNSGDNHHQQSHGVTNSGDS